MAKDDLQTTWRDSKDAAIDSAHQARQGVEDAALQLRTKVGSRIERGVEAASDRLDEINDRLGAAADRGSRALDDAARKP